MKKTFHNHNMTVPGSLASTRFGLGAVFGPGRAMGPSAVDSYERLMSFAAGDAVRVKVRPVEIWIPLPNGGCD